jgi:hypothetical protein
MILYFNVEQWKYDVLSPLFTPMIYRWIMLKDKFVTLLTLHEVDCKESRLITVVH